MSNGPADLANWTNQQLMGPHDAATLAKMKKKNPDLWGRPGFLTEEEAKTYVSTPDKKSSDEEKRKKQIQLGSLEWRGIPMLRPKFLRTHPFPALARKLTQY